MRITGRITKPSKFTPGPDIIPEIRNEDLKPTLQDYFDQIVKAGNKKCGFCNYPFLLRNLQHYNHSGGWPLEGSVGLQWIYLHCSNCKYDWAISKLGVKK